MCSCLSTFLDLCNRVGHFAVTPLEHEKIENEQKKAICFALTLLFPANRLTQSGSHSSKIRPEMYE